MHHLRNIIIVETDKILHEHVRQELPSLKEYLPISLYFIQFHFF